MTRNTAAFAVFLIFSPLTLCNDHLVADEGLIGYWILKGDCEDHSGQDHHGINHGVNLESGQFDGSGSYIEIPDSPAFDFGAGAFSISAWIFTDEELTDVFGDVISKFDPARRNGFNLTVSGSAPGYNSMSNARSVQFGIDDGAAGQWTDCGRPGGKSHNSDALTVFQGHLYAGTTDAPQQEDWAHVFRYQRGQLWEECGRVGNGRTRGVYAMIVHNDELYAATSASHGPQPNTMDFGRVYRYRGGQQWEDIGQPGDNYRLNSLASYRGKLYVCGFNIGPDPGHCYVYEGGARWEPCGEFNGWPHTMAVHDGKLFTAYPKGEVFAYDGNEWENLGNPFGSFDECNQIHSLGVHRGELHAGTWPKGRIAVLSEGHWVDRGRPGDATEVIGMAVYNGSFYAGTIPRAEVFRWDQDIGWTSIRRLFDPPGFEPVPVGSNDAQGVADWSRATSLTVFDGKLFASTGTCYRMMMELPRPDEMRGKVYSFQAGANVTFDSDLGPGWKHLVALRDRDQMKLYVNGQLSAMSNIETPALDISNDEPLKIGFGQVDFFHGNMREVRLYNRALAEHEIQSLSRE